MEQLTKSEKINLGTKEITKRVREQLKKEFPDCKFSVSFESYSGGSSIHINLMESNFKVIKNFSEISERALFKMENESNYTKEAIQQFQLKRNHQLNIYTLREDFDSDSWCNGVFLTEQGHKLFRRVVEIVDYYNYDESDPQIDYFNVNFYEHLNIGKWDKPFIQKEVN